MSSSHLQFGAASAIFRIVLVKQSHGYLPFIRTKKTQPTVQTVAAMVHVPMTCRTVAVGYYLEVELRFSFIVQVY